MAATRDARDVAATTIPIERPSASSSADERDPTEDDRPAPTTPVAAVTGVAIIAAERTPGVAQVVEVAVERRAAVGEVQDRDVGEEEEQRADGDAHRRAVPGVSSTASSPVRGRRVGAARRRPEQHHAEGEARDRDRHPGPAEHRAGAVGERRSRPARRGRSTARGRRCAPTTNRPTASDVGPVAGELARGRVAAPRQRARLRRAPRLTVVAGSRAARRAGCSASGRGTTRDPPRLGRRHPRTLTPQHQPQEHPRSRRTEHVHSGVRRTDRHAEGRAQTSMTTGMTAGRRLVRSLMNLPSDRRRGGGASRSRWRPRRPPPASDARTAAFASSSSSSASGA